LDLLLAVSGADACDEHKRKCRSRQRRCRSSAHRDSPFPARRETTTNLTRPLNSRCFFCSFVQGKEIPRNRGPRRERDQVKSFRAKERLSAPSDGARTRHRGLLLVATVAALAAAAAFLLPGAQVATGAPLCGTASVLDQSNFEIDTDANLTVDGGGTCIDWLA